MSDHADVSAYKQNLIDRLQVENAALVAERDEARRTRFQADNMIVVPEDALIRERLRAEAAEARVAALTEALEGVGAWLRVGATHTEGCPAKQWGTEWENECNCGLADSRGVARAALAAGEET